MKLNKVPVGFSHHVVSDLQKKIMGNLKNAAILVYLFTKWHQDVLEDIDIYTEESWKITYIFKHMYNQNTAFPVIQYSYLLFSINLRLANLFSSSTI